MTIGKRIKDAREAIGLNQEELAQRVRVGQSTVADWESDKTTPRRKTLPTLAAMLGRTEAWILLGIEPSTTPAIQSAEVAPTHGLERREAPDLPAPSSMPRDIPVRGTGRGDNDGGGDFTFNGEVAGYVRRPPGLLGVRNAFALYVQGDSMSPWREPGQMVYVHPNRPARTGDHVIVEMHPETEGEPGTVWIKKLVARSPDGSLILRQYNPPNDRIRIRGDRVLRVYRVMEWDELMGA